MGVELHNQTKKTQNPSQTQDPTKAQTQTPTGGGGGMPGLNCWNLGPTHPPISVPKHPWDLAH